MAQLRTRAAVTYQVAAIALVLILALCASVLPSLAEKRIALVIGNGKYVRDPLPNPPRDAALIARTRRAAYRRRASDPGRTSTCARHADSRILQRTR